MRFKVLNTLDLAGSPEAVAAFDGLAQLDTLPWDYEAVRGAIGGYDAYLASTSVRVDEGILENATKLKVIGSPATGTDHLDMAAINRRGIPCFNIAKEMDLLRSFSATSELAFGLLLALNRKIDQAVAATRAGDWARERFTGIQLLGKTLGILGLGRLGTISARIGQGFGMNVIARDILPVSAPGVEMVSFDELFQRADVLTIHVHLNDTTRGLVDRRALSLMKPGAFLINTSRGGLVDEAALLDALQEKRIAGAGLDVIDGEWMDDILDHPLVQYSRQNENLLITPHIGGATVESIYGARVFMARKVADFLRRL
jgi:D-3-phosphoglycerate dehydrogenase